MTSISTVTPGGFYVSVSDHSHPDFDAEDERDARWTGSSLLRRPARSLRRCVRSLHPDRLDRGAEHDREEHLRMG